MCYLFGFLVVARAVPHVVACCSRDVRAGRAHCFVCRQRAMSRMSARRLHTVVLFRAPSARYVARVVQKLAYCFVHRKLTSIRISRANYISYLFDSC